MDGHNLNELELGTRPNVPVEVDEEDDFDDAATLYSESASSVPLLPSSQNPLPFSPDSPGNPTTIIQSTVASLKGLGDAVIEKCTGVG
jgi:hypothetical protein